MGKRTAVTAESIAAEAGSVVAVAEGVTSTGASSC
jgi:hypothetical protein